MTETRFLRLMLVAWGSAMTLIACGGGAGSSSSSSSAGSVSGASASSSAAASVVATVTTTGVITGFGSIYVNGVRYDTSSASFNINDAAGSQADLNVGDVITLSGHRDSNGNSFADAVSFDDAVKGQIQSINLTAGTLVVLGQTVLVDADTSFDDSITGASLAGLAVGDWIEVSGLPDASGVIHATRLEKESNVVTLETTGIVSAVNSVTRRFSVNGLVVSYATAAVEGFISTDPANGDLVEVRGSSLNTAGELVATRVKLKRAVRTQSSSESSAASVSSSGSVSSASSSRSSSSRSSVSSSVSTSSTSTASTSVASASTSSSSAVAVTEVEGFVTRFVSLTDFDVSGQPVTTSSATVYENGSSADLLLNAKVEVEGSLNSSGVLLADKVKFKRSNAARITGLIDAVDSSAGTITVLGVTITLDANTRMEDKSDVRLTSLRIANLAVGNFVEVRGQETTGNRVLASRLERDDLDNDRELQGVVDSVGSDSVSVLGVTIRFSSSTQFAALDGSSLSAAAFAASVVGQVVKAKGSYSAGVLLATELELESGT